MVNDVSLTCVQAGLPQTILKKMYLNLQFHCTTFSANAASGSFAASFIAAAITPNISAKIAKNSSITNSTAFNPITADTGCNTTYGAIADIADRAAGASGTDATSFIVQVIIFAVIVKVVHNFLRTLLIAIVIVCANDTQHENAHSNV